MKKKLLVLGICALAALNLMTYSNAKAFYYPYAECCSPTGGNDFLLMVRGTIPCYLCEEDYKVCNHIEWPVDIDGTCHPVVNAKCCTDETGMYCGDFQNCSHDDR